MNLTRAAFKIHRVLSYLVFAQVLAWICGGVVFALLPFDSVVKGGAAAAKPTTRLTGNWQRTLGSVPAAIGEITRIETFASPFGTAFRVRGAAGQVLVPADGSSWRAPDAASISRWAQSLYRGGGRLARVDRVEGGERRVGIVQETGGRRDLWRARFADRLHTRLYFDGASGEFLIVRNDAWVLYDFFFRLHVMDYASGEDFNNTPLRVFAVCALAFALSGAILTFAAARRALRAARQRRADAA